MAWKFDLNLGHYVKLNEADETASVQDTSASTDATTDLSSAKAKTFRGIDQDETVQGLKEKITDLKAKHSRDIASLDQQLSSAKQAVQTSLSSGTSTYTSVYDPSETDSNILSIENQKLSSEKQYQDQLYSLEQQLLARKKALASVTEARAIFPEKLHRIDESTLNNNKIFLKNILYKDGPYSEKVGNMAAFNRLFRESGLLYGKDRKLGYYVICIDKDDFNILVKTLQTIGISKREIMGEVMPQLMDRKSLASI